MKVVHFLLLLLFIYSPSFSQKKLTFDIKAGYINSWNSTPGITYVSILDKGHQNSFTGGVSGSYNLNKHFSVEANLLFSAKGYKLNSFQLYDAQGNKLNMTPTHTYSMSYIDLPVYIKYSFGKKVRPFIGAGAALSFNVSHNYGKPYVSGNTNGGDSVYVSPSNKPQSVYGSFVATAGVSYNRISFQFLWMLGISPAIKAGNLTMSQGYTTNYTSMELDKTYYTRTLYYPPTTVKATHLNSVSFMISYRLNKSL